jgi:HEAT repeat protein
MNLTHPDPSTRLRAALDAGTTGNVTVDELIARCAVEPDFFVRDMLTWALTRHPAALTVPALLDELHSTVPQARSQALHTLSKIGDAATTPVYPRITDDLLRDADEEVARTAWRAAVGFVPHRDAGRLATRLSSQLGRGPREIRRSLSRAYLDLGEAGRPALESVASTRPAAPAGLHAAATLILLDDPDHGFDAAEYAVTVAEQDPSRGH